MFVQVIIFLASLVLISHLIFFKKQGEPMWLTAENDSSLVKYENHILPKLLA